jgi:hypothetical protein
MHCIHQDVLHSVYYRSHPQVLVYYRIHQHQISPLDQSGMNSAWHKKMEGSGDFQDSLRLGILTVCTGRYWYNISNVTSNVISSLPRKRSLPLYYGYPPHIESATKHPRPPHHSHSAPATPQGGKKQKNNLAGGFDDPDAKTLLRNRILFLSGLFWSWRFEYVGTKGI